MSATLTEAEARGLATQVVKDTKSARVKIGRTNGAPRLHVMIPADQALNDAGVGDPTLASYTIRDNSDWETCPLNQRLKRNKDFAEQQPTEALMASNGRKARR